MWPGFRLSTFQVESEIRLGISPILIRGWHASLILLGLGKHAYSPTKLGNKHATLCNLNSQTQSDFMPRTRRGSGTPARIRKQTLEYHLDFDI
jgi:hypothetical protein